MKHIVKWGIIGLGNIAFKFANAFYNADNAELIAVASKSNEKLIKFKQNFNLRNESLELPEQICCEMLYFHPPDIPILHHHYRTRLLIAN